MSKQPIRYFVGDPAFLLPAQTWVDCCEILDKYDKKMMYQKFKEAVAEALTDFTGHQAYISEIGSKVWMNAISGEGVLKSDFISESGFVSVSRITSKSLHLLFDKYGKENALVGLAMLNTSNNITVDFDKSNKDWTVVNIIDNTTHHKISSIKNCFYEECDEPTDSRKMPLRAFSLKEA